jgi:outer membrane protein
MRGRRLAGILFLLIGISLGPAFGWSGDIEEELGLTLQQAAALALERNPQALMARARTDALAGKIKEVRSQALPNIALNGSGLRWRDPSFLNASSFDKIPPEFRDALTVTPANLFDYSISISQPLYTSGKVGTALKLASLESEGAGVDQARTDQEIRLQVIRAFCGLLLAQEQVRVARETVQQREKHLEMAAARFAAGAATQVDVLRSQVSVANAQPALIRAESGVRQARSVLNNLLVRPLDFPTEAVGTLDFRPGVALSLGEVIRRAQEHRPELQRVRIDVLESKDQLKLANAESRLRLDFNGQYGVSARDPANLLSREFTRWVFTFTVSLPVFDGGRRSGLVQQAVANRRVADLAAVEAESKVSLEAQTALDELARAKQTVEAARVGVREAEQVLEMTQNNYKYGAATTLDVLDAQTALTIARATLIQGLYDHTLAKAQLHYVMGLDPLEGIHAN